MLKDVKVKKEYDAIKNEFANLAFSLKKGKKKAGFIFNKIPLYFTAGTTRRI